MASIGFIGLGNMGGPMAANLVKAGEPRARVRPRAGVARSVGRRRRADRRQRAGAVEDADVVITMLPAGKQVLSVWNEVVPRARQGALFIDCSTIDVESAARPTRWRPSAASPRSMRRCRAASAAPRPRR